MSRTKTSRPYSKTPTVPIAVSPAQAQALGVIAAQRSVDAERRVFIADLVAEAVIAMFGPDIQAVLTARACPVCGIVGGCEHTFRDEIK